MSFDRFLILSIYVTFSLMKTLEKYLYGNTFMQVFCASSQPSDRKKDKTILNNVSATFEEGIFYTIVGPSGAGKTTLLLPEVPPRSP